MNVCVCGDSGWFMYVGSNRPIRLQSRGFLFPVENLVGVFYGANRNLQKLHENITRDVDFMLIIR